ncbi:hypothetical protein [Kocuria sp. KH4]
MVERRTLTTAPPVTTGADAAAALAAESSIKRLVREALKTDTTPHGVKVAAEGEGTAYAMPDGTHLLLDGMKAAQWDAEIAGARRAVEDARLVVEEAQTSLNATEQRLATMDQDIVEIRGGDIDVPGTLAAKVVEAMDIETKRLVVTEDAILNQVTAIESIVTPTLVANRIVLGDLGHDLMQNAALTVVGPTGRVELSGAGYQAWNAQGQLTVKLSGANNLITGDLQTAAAGTRALISTRDQKSAMDFFVGDGADHGGIWYDGGAVRTLTVGVMPDGGFNANTSASMRFVLDQKLLQVNAIMGTSNRQQHGYYTWAAPGIPANGSSAEVTIPFPQVMSDAGQIYIHFQPEAPSGARMTVTQTYTSPTEIRFILHNHSNFATGRMWLWWTAITRSRWWA